MFSVAQAALRLGVCTKTIRRWDAAGKLHCTRTPGGHRRISATELDRLLGLLRKEIISSPRGRRCAVYARVSGHRQKLDGDPDRQLQSLTEACKTRFKYSPLVSTDIGSGLNMRRAGLRRLLGMARKGAIDTLLITHRDRLVPFGFELLERILLDYAAAVV